MRWTELQENLDRVLYNQALNLAQNTLDKFEVLQSSPWPEGAARARPARPEAHLGAVGGRSGGGEVAGDGSRRRPAATTAAARGKPARRRDAGQLASARATLESRGATGVVNRRRARAVSSSTGRRQQWRLAARDGARRGARGFYTRLGTSVGDRG
jgi:hypothetical protein